MRACSRREAHDGLRGSKCCKPIITIPGNYWLTPLRFDKDRHRVIRILRPAARKSARTGDAGVGAARGIARVKPMQHAPGSCPLPATTDMDTGLTLSFGLPLDVAAQVQPESLANVWGTLNHLMACHLPPVLELFKSRVSIIAPKGSIAF